MLDFEVVEARNIDEYIYWKVITVEVFNSREHIVKLGGGQVERRTFRNVIRVYPCRNTSNFEPRREKTVHRYFTDKGLELGWC